MNAVDAFLANLAEYFNNSSVKTDSCIKNETFGV